MTMTVAASAPRRIETADNIESMRNDDDADEPD